MVDGSAYVSQLQMVTWLEGAGTYEVASPLNIRAQDPSYCLSIYDMTIRACQTQAAAPPGIPYDFPEGGSLQYANASQIEKFPDFQNQQQIQRWNSTRPGNLNQKIDPHNIVGSP